MCEHCLASECRAQGTQDDGTHLIADGMIVNDCRADGRFAGRPYVTPEEGSRVRFYAGVPLVSREGYKIGVLAATDENPRDGLTAEELRYMQDMAQCAMEHLEWARDRVDAFRGQRVVQAMAAFIAKASQLINTTAAGGSVSVVLGDRKPIPHSERIATDDDPNTDCAPAGEYSQDRICPPQGIADPQEESSIFSCAADILREATLADGCIILGPQVNHSVRSTDSLEPGGSATFQKPNAGKGGTSSSYCPCTIFTLSSADQTVDCPVRKGVGSPITLETLYEYFRLYPRSSEISFTGDGETILPDEQLGRSTGIEGHTPGIDPQKSKTTRTDNIIRGSTSALDRLNHRKLLKMLPGARTVVFLPLFDPSQQKLIGAAFLWTLTAGRLVGAELTHLQAFADCIVSQNLRAELERNEAAKTTFIASISHELRSPLHGILGAAEFLVETTRNAYETGLVMSIITCGKTLLDTLSHVLDHSKINRVDAASESRERDDGSKNEAGASLDGVNSTTAVDLSALFEEVAESVTAGHTFQLSHSKRATSSVHKMPGASFFNTKPRQGEDVKLKDSEGVTILLDITPRDNWIVEVQPGALQRIIMNLLGNALKYTTTGFVALSLRSLKSINDNNISVLFRVADSGNGIGEAFQRDRLFVPFSQEDPFQSGTGLGLSIVKQIVESLGGSIEVFSATGKGTQVDVYLQLRLRSAMTPHNHDVLDLHLADQAPIEFYDHPRAIAPSMAGKKIILLDPLDPGKTRSPTHQATRFQQTLRETCEQWFGMDVSRSTGIKPDDDVAIYLYGEPPPLEMLLHHKRTHGRQPIPVIIACQNDHDAMIVTRDNQEFLRQLGEIVEVIQQPCGPRKLAKTFLFCLKKAEESGTRKGNISDTSDSSSISQLLFEFNKKEVEPSGSSTSTVIASRPRYTSQSASRTVSQELRESVSAVTALPTPLSLDPETPYLRSQEGGDTSLDLLASPESVRDTGEDEFKPVPDAVSTQQAQARKLHLLIVDDNKINRQLLATFARKCKFTYVEAENGQDAVSHFSATLQQVQDDRNNTPTGQSAKFDFVLMDISMPVMDGLEATKRIRHLEHTDATERTKIFALTGLASEETRKEAEIAGIDLFLPKPVKFAKLKELLV
jgi:signal transduction histidine kinase/CheY-like chemotaxis protein